MNYYQTNTVVTLNWHKLVRGSGFPKQVKNYLNY
jgi:hypothetical protein